MRRTKLICTLGPASDTSAHLEALLEAGMDVARFNFSHGTHEEHRVRLERLRAASLRTHKEVAVLQDLCGPKIRTGWVPQSYLLEDGATITLLEGERSENPSVIAIGYEGLAEDVHVGDQILFDDGRIVLRVLAVQGGKVQAEVVQGGAMRSHVGVHLPSRSMRMGSLTEKDREDLLFGLAQGVDYIALSFVRRAEDLIQVRDLCKQAGAPTPLIAKLETPEALENLESIMEASDGVMVARGDLGVEFPPERVPVMQRQILDVARRVRRPVIVATEMLQSMTQATRPTRAEASDVANAIFSGADAIMLSGETATGNHPALAASMMCRIAREAEESPFCEHNPYASPATSIPEAVARGACDTAREINAKLLVAFTETGSSALHVSLARPHVPIVGFSTNLHTRRKMGLFWGVHARSAPESSGLNTLVEKCNQDLLAAGLVSPGDRIVIVFGAPFGVVGSTNSIRVHVITASDSHSLSLPLGIPCV